MQTPGAMYEHFFEEVGKPAEGGEGPLDFGEQPDAERIVEVSAEHGI